MLAAARRLKGQRRAASQRAKFSGSMAIVVAAHLIPGYAMAIPGLALREFGGKLLMRLAIVEAKMAVPG